jgi:hypothetical protein
MWVSTLFLIYSLSTHLIVFYICTKSKCMTFQSQSTFICCHCRRRKNVRLKRPQRYCGSKVCQQARKNKWNRDKNRSDSTYRLKRSSSKKAWYKIIRETVISHLTVQPIPIMYPAIVKSNVCEQGCPSRGGLRRKREAKSRFHEQKLIKRLTMGDELARQSKVR